MTLLCRPTRKSLRNTTEGIAERSSVAKAARWLVNAPCRTGIPGEPEEISLSNGIVANLGMMVSYRAGESRCSALADVGITLIVFFASSLGVARNFLR